MTFACTFFEWLQWAKNIFKNFLLYSFYFTEINWTETCYICFTSYSRLLLYYACIKLCLEALFDLKDDRWTANDLFAINLNGT